MNANALAARGAIVVLAAMTGSVGLSGCGGAKSAPAASATEVAAAPLAATTPAATAAARSTTTPSKRAADAATRGSSTPAQPGADTATTSGAKGKTPAPSAQKKRPPAKRPLPVKGSPKRPQPGAEPAAEQAPATASATPLGPTAPADTEPDPPGANPPADCLRSAGMSDVVKRMNSIWSGKTPSGVEIFVDGPYGSAERAHESAKLLSEVNHADAGGRYQVTGPLRADVGTQVSAVARCLDRKA